MGTLLKIEGYKLQLEKIFGEATIENVGKAIATFERATGRPRAVRSLRSLEAAVHVG